MLQIWQQLVNRQILLSRLKKYKLLYRDSEILTETCFALIDKFLQLWEFFPQEKPHLESVLKLAVLQDEIRKLAKPVFPASALSCVIVHSVISVHLGGPLVLLTFGCFLLP